MFTTLTHVDGGDADLNPAPGLGYYLSKHSILILYFMLFFGVEMGMWTTYYPKNKVLGCFRECISFLLREMTGEYGFLSLTGCAFGRNIENMKED